MDWALGLATVMGRFAEGDLASIIAIRPLRPREGRRAGEGRTLHPGTSAWLRLRPMSVVWECGSCTTAGAR